MPDPLDAATLGKIVFARFLSMPLKSFERCVANTESSVSFLALRHCARPSVLSRSHHLTTDVGESVSSLDEGLGEVQLSAGRPVFVYRSWAFEREYRFDQEAIKWLRPTLSSDQIASLHRLRLINSRNQLTHALIQTLLDVQSDYLISGDPLALNALPQARMVRMLAARRDLPVVADASRLSRLIRGLAFKMPDERTRPLNTLFPSERQIHCHRIHALLKTEQSQLLAGCLDRPLSDKAIAEALARQYGSVVSRRTVAAIRHHLAIPHWRRRAVHESYLAATEGFSPLLAMTPLSVNGSIPSRPGVYEIRSAAGSDDAHSIDGASPVAPSQVVYIGSTRNLRKRLAAHVRGNGGNVRLFRLLMTGEATVRYRAVSMDWRLLERRLYNAFRETFGAAPLCNRMSP